MPLTPVEIQRVELKRSANGYDCAEADRLIEEFATGYEALWLERIELQERVKGLERRLARSRRRHTVAAGLLLAAVVAGALVLWLRWNEGSTETAARPALRGPDTPVVGQTAGADAAAVDREAAPVSDAAVPPANDATHPTSARLVLRATRGDSWLSVRVGSETGEILYEGTLATGRTLRFVRNRLWFRVGAPANLDVRLNGEPAKGFPRSTADVVVTPRGLGNVSPG
jgi:DivIVA protein/RodZ C-terminal domain